MIKKILFFFLITCSTIVFSQEITIEKLSTAPNPFSSNTTISFNAKNANTKVILTVKNVLGKTVFKESYKSKVGKNKIPFSKGKLSAGIYIYSIQTSKKIISKRFVIK